MAKNTKKKLEEAPAQAVLDTLSPELQSETPPEPDDEQTPPESAHETEPEESEPEESPDGTTVEPYESKLEPRKHGPTPNKFGQKDETILDRLMGLPTWEGVWAYVYRIQPFSNRLVGGNRKVHVKRYDAPFDVQDLMNEAGSGVYQIQATRLQPATGKRPMFDSGEIRILNQNHPPKIPPGEWVDDPKNKEWQWAKEAIFKKEAPPAAPAPPDPLVGLLQDTINAQREEMREMRSEIRNAAAQASKKDPGEITLASILAPFLPAIAKKLMEAPPDPMASLTAAITLLKEVNPPAPTVAAVDPMTALDKQLELHKKLEDITGKDTGGGRSRMTGGEEMFVKAMEHLGPAIAEGTKLVGGLIMLKAQKDMQQPQQPAPAFTPQPQPGQPEPWTPQQPQQQRPGQQKPQPPKPVIGDIAQSVLDHLQAGKDGFELGDWYLEKYGEDEFLEARAQGTNQLMLDLQKVPNLWRFLAEFYENKKLQVLLKEFVTWTQPDDEDDEEEEEDTPTAAPSNAKPIQDGWTTPGPVEVQQ